MESRDITELTLLIMRLGSFSSLGCDPVLTNCVSPFNALSSSRKRYSLGRIVRRDHVLGKLPPVATLAFFI